VWSLGGGRGGWWLFGVGADRGGGFVRGAFGCWRGCRYSLRGASAGLEGKERAITGERARVSVIGASWR